jgi:hypothetical protein
METDGVSRCSASQTRLGGRGRYLSEGRRKFLDMVVGKSHAGKGVRGSQGSLVPLKNSGRVPGLWLREDEFNMDLRILKVGDTEII